MAYALCRINHDPPPKIHDGGGKRESDNQQILRLAYRDLDSPGDHDYYSGFPHFGLIPMMDDAQSVARI